MAKPGPARRPALQVVREGNPGHRTQGDLDNGVRLKPQAPDEPDWRAWFPAVKRPTKKQLEKRYDLATVEGSLVHITDDAKRERLTRARQRWLIDNAQETAERTRSENQRARDVARDEWRRVVPPLDAQGLLAVVDRQVLVDYCIVVARIDQAERNLSSHGLWVKGERGAVKNPSTTILNQLRSAAKFYVGELGLSPVARDAMPAGGDDGTEEDAFD